MTNGPSILAVDDDATCLEIIEETLKKAGYEVITAPNGKEGLIQLMHARPIDVILLDWMMPVMDGMEFLKRIKSIPNYCDIPVIMQTARICSDSVKHGLEAGAYYYLQKPYDSKVLQALVHAARRDRMNLQSLHRSCNQLSERAQDFCRALMRMKNSEFTFRTPAQARRIAALVASCFPEPSKVVVGFMELMMNAIEHGNLGITYEEKRDLIRENRWDDVVSLKLQDQAFQEKEAHIRLVKHGREIQVVIEDQGAGFDWRRFLTITPDRADSPNGRGIFLATLDFDSIHYEGCGNRVVCTKTL